MIVTVIQSMTQLKQITSSGRMQEVGNRLRVPFTPSLPPCTSTVTATPTHFLLTKRVVQMVEIQPPTALHCSFLVSSLKINRKCWAHWEYFQHVSHSLICLKGEHKKGVRWMVGKQTATFHTVLWGHTVVWGQQWQDASDWVVDHFGASLMIAERNLHVQRQFTWYVKGQIYNSYDNPNYEIAITLIHLFWIPNSISLATVRSRIRWSSSVSAIQILLIQETYEGFLLRAALQLMFSLNK